IDNLVLSDTVSPVIMGQVIGTPGGFSAVTTPVAGTGTRYDWTNTAPVLPGATKVFTVDGTVGLVCAATTVSNTALVSAVTACTATSQMAVASGFTVAAPVLSYTVVKTQTGGAGVGEPIHYDIVITNTGGATIDNLTLTDTVSGVVTGVVTTPAAGFGAAAVASIAGTGTRYVWSVGSGLNFTPGSVLTFQVDGTIGLVCAATPVNNTAMANGGTIQPPTYAYTVTKVQTPANPGTGVAVNYTITVVNTGTGTIDNLVLSDTVSPVITGQTQVTAPGFSMAIANPATG